MGKRIRLLCADCDRESLADIREQLDKKGLRVSELDASANRNETVLAVLSEGVYADGALTEKLLGLIGSGTDQVLPLQLDGAPIPEQIKNVLYARNIIPAEGRDASLIAERIISALPKKKSRMPLLLASAGVLLLAIVGLLIWRSASGGEIFHGGKAKDQIVLPAALGITEEDLALVENVVVVGDRIALFQKYEIKNYATMGDAIFMPDDANQSWDHFAYLDEWHDVHWYSKETGEELSMAHWDDLRFIGLMPNLRSLTLVLVETDEAALPDLRGADKLERVDIESCGFESIDWLAGSSTENLTLRFTPIMDFGALTACEKLSVMSVDMYGVSREADFTAFAPPQLESFWIYHANSGGKIDLSSLRSCPELSSVTFGDMPLNDLSCLDAAQKLSYLDLHEMDELRSLKGIEGLPIAWFHMDYCNQLRDIAAVGELRNLRELKIESCGGLRDFSPAGNCARLERFYVWGMHGQVRDVSFLAALTHLHTIELFDVDLPNLDFLQAFSGTKELNLAFSGNIWDYSGMNYVKSYEYLHINPMNGNLAAVLPYLQGAEARTLHLHECRNTDLSLLPEVTEALEIWYGDLRDLSSMPALKVDQLYLYDLQYLSSLDGIQNLPNLSKGQSGALLSVSGCPRLNDWSAIEGARFDKLILDHVYTLPPLDKVDFGTLRIEGVDALKDLHFLDSKPDDWQYSWIRLVDENNLRDLSPLRRLRGERLTVDPALAEQAEELQTMERIREYSIEYPEGSFQPFEGNVKLLSLDELDTLPASMLKKVGRLCVVGDRLVDMDDYDIRWNDAQGQELPVVILRDRISSEEFELEYAMGSVTDLGRFAALSGLWELRLYAQPLEDLNGIQNFGELTSVGISCCPQLRDASAAFACQEIRYLCIDCCPIESIGGIQNLSGLVDLNINRTQVRDLSPLSSCDLSAAMEERGGLSLYLSDVPIEDYAPLTELAAINRLDINNADAARYIPYLQDTPLRELSACNSFTSHSEAEDPNALFAGFVRAHPGLRELWIPWNQGITDFTPLLDLEELEYVRVSFDMRQAIESLDGADYHFVLEIEGQ